MTAPMNEWSVPIEQAVACTYDMHVDGESCQNYGMGCHHACPCCMGTFFLVEVVETKVKTYAVIAKNKVDAASIIVKQSTSFYDSDIVIPISDSVQDWFLDEESV